MENEPSISERRRTRIPWSHTPSIDPNAAVSSKDVTINPQSNISAAPSVPPSPSPLNTTTISVNYRLAPEYPIPAAYEDCWAALQWAALHRYKSGPEPWLNDHADFDRVFLAGDSSGANIVHNLAMVVGGWVWLKLRKLKGKIMRFISTTLHAIKLQDFIKSLAYFFNRDPPPLI